jgi:hypothetical protein
VLIRRSVSLTGVPGATSLEPRTVADALGCRGSGRAGGDSGNGGNGAHDGRAPERHCPTTLRDAAGLTAWSAAADA